MTRIAITWSSRPPDHTTDNYRRAVRQAGGEPLVLHAGQAKVPADLANVHGLLLAGGGDVNPARYGEEPHPLTADVEDDRDELELAAVAEARRRKLPILGICRGFQVLNVAFGGKLLQHVDDHASQEGISRRHTIDVGTGSRLSTLLAAEGPVAANSRHHQAVTPEVVAAGLEICATSADGLVEGLESGAPGEWIVALQCHPERSTEVDERFAKLFAAFVAAAQRARDAQ